MSRDGEVLAMACTSALREPADEPFGWSLLTDADRDVLEEAAFGLAVIVASWCDYSPRLADQLERLLLAANDGRTC